jgi:hypothetical protein
LGFRIVRPFDSPEVSEQGRWWEADIESVRKAVDWQTQIGRAASGLVDKEVRRQLEATFQERRSQKDSIKLPP